MPMEIRNKMQEVFIHENAFENVFCILFPLHMAQLMFRGLIITTGP